MCCNKSVYVYRHVHGWLDTNQKFDSSVVVGGECNFVMDFTSLTVGGFTQPTTATNIMVVPGNAEKGLSQRFLWICPKPVFLEYDSLGKVDQVFYDKVGELKIIEAECRHAIFFVILYIEVIN